MKHPLETGDRVAWTEDDRGIIVADSAATCGRTFTVAVWRPRGFSGHLTRLPAAMLHRTSRLVPMTPRADGHA